MNYFDLNAHLNITDGGEYQLDKDKEAVRQYFLQHVNQNTVFFHSLDEKLSYLIDNEYYEAEVLGQYGFEDIKELFKHAYSYKFRFQSFLGAYKFYTSYALKTFDGERYLERYEDRVCMTALTLAQGDVSMATTLVDEMVTGRFQPATPTFLNAGRKQRGELVSCFLMRVEDNMESISRAITNSLQLSKRGGGVALLLSNIREEGAPIKKVEGCSSGIVPVMKMLEDAFSYANQLGSRQGAGAVYLNVHHPDIMKFLDTKRENADEKIRIKTLSLGVVIPDITFELAKNNEDMYLFSPYDVERVYGKPFCDISITEHYKEMVDNPDIRKKKIKAREMFKVLAELQFESGYPYVLFEDNATKANPLEGRINMSNLCSEILQTNSPSEFGKDGAYTVLGKDISCNLGSMNVAKAMDGGDLEKTVSTAIKALTAVSEMSELETAPPVHEGNQTTHAIGLGQMNLHGFLGREGFEYGGQDALDFTDMYFQTVTYNAIKASMELAKDKQESFKGFAESSYADGSYFDKYTKEDARPNNFKVKQMFREYGVKVPTPLDWEQLKDDVLRNGIYNAYLQAVPPTGSISYINNSTSSIHPIASQIEVRKEGKLGRVYYPAPHMTNDNKHFFKDAYALGWKALIDTYAAASKHVDQGLSCTLFFPHDATTREINKAQIYAWQKGLKTLYYIRLRQEALKGTEVKECEACML